MGNNTELTAFGKYLVDKGLDRREVATALDVTQSYVSMLARGSASPAFKLALRFAKYTKERYGVEGAFLCEAWGE